MNSSSSHRVPILTTGTNPFMGGGGGGGGGGGRAWPGTGVKPHIEIGW